MSEHSFEDFLNRLSTLAAKTLRAPVAFVTFLEEERQVFRGRSVASGPLLEVTETPLTHSICNVVATRRHSLMIEDTRVHPLVCDNPVVQEAQVYAYAGVPLFHPDGEIIGAFCAIDYETHSWCAEDMETLQVLAAQVRSELALRASLEKLETANRQLTAKEATLNRNHREDRHDLRTPLNALMLSLQAVRLMGDLNEDQAEYLTLAERNGADLASMIDQMLDIANIDSRGNEAIHRRPWNPAEIVSTALHQVSMLARQKRITLRQQLHAPNEISCDRDKIVRVLVNLIGNALKFSPEEREVLISVEAVPYSSAIGFAVQDNGIGMAPEHLERIFAEGYRVDPTRPTQQSTGLGLTFCKRVIEAHQGRIWVESTPGHGSTFRFTLPQPHLATPLA